MSADAHAAAGPGMSKEIVLAEALRALLPTDVAVAGGPIASAQGPLFAIEERALTTAVHVRQIEFRAGRSYARAALRQLGVPDQPIVQAADRRPLWPDGFVGAISHSRALCAAAAASDASYLGLGLDLEPATALDPELIPIVARPHESAALCRRVVTEDAAVDSAKLLFCAKESVFKACYPLTLEWLDFQDVSIEFHAASDHFTATLEGTRVPLPGGPRIDGRWSIADGHVLTAIAIRWPDAGMR